MQKRNLPIKISMEGIEMVSFSQNPDPSKPQPFIFFYFFKLLLVDKLTRRVPFFRLLSLVKIIIIVVII